MVGPKVRITIYKSLQNSGDPCDIRHHHPVASQSPQQARLATDPVFCLNYQCQRVAGVVLLAP